MAPSAIVVREMLDNLDEEDCKAAIRYIQFLSESRKKESAAKSKSALKEIQGMLEGDSGWGSEEEMLEDMAEFRRKRLNK